MHEEKHRLKLLETERGAGKVGGLDADEATLFLGTSSARGSAAVSPTLLEFVSEQLKSEASIMKERRKAAEERALIKPAKGAGKET